MESKELVVFLKPYTGDGKLRAFADVTVQTPDGELTVKGYRVVENKMGGLFVAPPSISYEKAGQRINKPVVEMGRALQKKIADAVMAEYKKVMGTPA